MPSIINATTTTGLVSSADNSGSLQLATNNGTTAVTIGTDQKVGIGTSTLTNRLNVAGAIQSSSTLVAVEANTAALSQESGYSRLAAFGPNSSTGGTLYLYSISSNGSVQNGQIIDSAGRVTTPSQPAFMAYLNTSFTNVSPQTIVFDATQFNTGSNYSTSTGRFTAPVTGLYQFNIVCLVQGGAASMHDFSLQLNGSNYKNGRINAPDSTVNYACAIRLTANDYVSVQVSSTGRQIYGTSDWTYFSGFLVG